MAVAAALVMIATTTSFLRSRESSCAAVSMRGGWMMAGAACRPPLVDPHLEAEDDLGAEALEAVLAHDAGPGGADPLDLE
jgi:hypothetical protein